VLGSTVVGAAVEGLRDGITVGARVGTAVGRSVGSAVGLRLGASEGGRVGGLVGSDGVGVVGSSVGTADGVSVVGAGDGAAVGGAVGLHETSTCRAATARSMRPRTLIVVHYPSLQPRHRSAVEVRTSAWPRASGRLMAVLSAPGRAWPSVGLLVPSSVAVWRPESA
jgi:hypothetical protein